MKKFLLVALIFMLSLTLLPVSAVAEEGKLQDFTEDFEQYSADGGYIENDAVLTKKWDNNVFRGGAALGMDAHIYNIGKIEEEPGNEGNKVLHLKNTVGADSFFYMGPAGDYRVKNFTVTFKVKFLTEGVAERSWIGISMRKKAQTHYTGTNNLMMVIQRYVNSAQIAGHAFATLDGGSPNDLNGMKELYGDRLSITSTPYTVPGATPNADTGWVEYKLKAEGNRYIIYVDGNVVSDCTFNINKYDYYGYLSLNCCTSNVLVDDFNLQIQDTELPPEILKLGTPQISIDEQSKEVRWQAVEGASFYTVRIGETTATVFDKTSYSLAKLKPGEYKISVMAASDDTFVMLDGDYSAELTYTVEQPKDEEEGKKKGCGSVASAASVIALATILVGAFGLKRKK